MNDGALPRPDMANGVPRLVVFERAFQGAVLGLQLDELSALFIHSPNEDVSLRLVEQVDKTATDATQAILGMI
ncbi:hypothetical protein P350_09630 [Burkholderia cepacia JBK9]|nr:hypothetical protein P350_09630 [Burkholderia cepacia JBK9]